MVDAIVITALDMVDPELLLNFVGAVDIRRYGHYITCPCPIHRGDDQNFSYDLRSNTWTCFSHHCGEGTGLRRDGVLLLQLALGMNREEAKRVVKELAGMADTTAVTKEQLDAVKLRMLSRRLSVYLSSSNTPGIVGLPDLDHARTVAYMQYRGYDERTVEYFGLGVAKSGQLKGRLIIPIHDENGRLVGLSGRSIDHREPKYKHLYDFSKGLVLFNYHRALPYVQRSKRVIIVEGFFDAMRLFTLGYLNGVALMGTSISHSQTRLIAISGAESATIVLDGDDAGRRGARAVARQLRQYCAVDVIDLPDGKDVDTAPVEWLADILPPL